MSELEKKQENKVKKVFGNNFGDIIKGNFKSVCIDDLDRFDLNQTIIDNGKFFIHYVCIYGKMDFLMKCVRKNANIMLATKNIQKNCPLYYACLYNRESVVWFYIERGRRINNRNKLADLIRKISRKGYYNIVNILIDVNPDIVFQFKDEINSDGIPKFWKSSKYTTEEIKYLFSDVISQRIGGKVRKIKKSESCTCFPYFVTNDEIFVLLGKENRCRIDKDGDDVGIPMFCFGVDKKNEKKEYTVKIKIYGSKSYFIVHEKGIKDSIWKGMMNKSRNVLFPVSFNENDGELKIHFQNVDLKIIKMTEVTSRFSEFGGFRERDEKHNVLVTCSREIEEEILSLKNEEILSKNEFFRRENVKNLLEFDEGTLYAKIDCWRYYSNTYFLPMKGKIFLEKIPFDIEDEYKIFEYYLNKRITTIRQQKGIKGVEKFQFKFFKLSDIIKYFECCVKKRGIWETRKWGGDRIIFKRFIGEKLEKEQRVFKEIVADDCKEYDDDLGLLNFGIHYKIRAIVKNFPQKFIKKFFKK